MGLTPRQQQLEKNIEDFRLSGNPGLLYLKEDEVAFVESLNCSVKKTEFKNTLTNMFIYSVTPK